VSDHGHDLDRLLALATRVALAAGEVLLDGLSEDLAVDTKSSATDLVTDIDRYSERMVVAGLLDARPDDGVLGEEGTAIDGSSGITWVIDPLDGTTNFVYGHPGFSVSIAAMVDGVPSVGVVVDPLHDDIFSARTGGGALRNAAPVRCSNALDPARALVATGFSYQAAERAEQADVLLHLLPQIRDIRRMGGAAVDLCSVACARVDAYYERGLQPWDMAAGTVIAREAGARVGGLTSDEPGTDFLVAAPPALFETLVELLLAAGADTPPEQMATDGASPRRVAP
jgi:myo-inositol-1(or 4)-monophosphatase